MSDINIKEVIEDKNSWFNIKRFKIGSIRSETPIKTLDMTNINHKLFLINGFKQNVLFEKSKVIRNYDAIQNILNESDDNKINKFFGRAAWAKDYDHNVTLTLKFNPFKYVDKVSKFENFFDYYYQYSKSMLFVPNVKKERMNILTKKKEEIMSISDYIKFVNESHQILNYKNNKPIFVPVSLRYSMAELNELINFYLKKEYFYLWFDLEGKPINQAITARLNAINKQIKDKGRFKNTVSYITNIKREIISNKADELSPASDVLASTAGGNFIGVNREPARYIENAVPVPASEIWKHKARTFNPKTYYYVQQQGKLENKKENMTSNAKRLITEFSSQTKHFLDSGQIENYLQSKPMLTEYPNIFRQLIRKGKNRPKTVQRKLFLN